MDTIQESPNVLQAKKDSCTKGKLFENLKFKPMRSEELLESLGMKYSANKQSSTKKIKFLAKPLAELNLNDISITSEEPPRKNVRKQLWSVQKSATKVRRGTIMKPIKENVRKSVCTKPTLPNKINPNDSLPLVDVDEFEKPKLKRNLFAPLYSKPAPKLNVQRKTLSNIPSVKQETSNKIKRSIIVKPETTARNSLETKKSINEQKYLNDDIFKKLSNIETSLKRLESLENSLNRLETLENSISEIKSFLNEKFLCKNCACQYENNLSKIDKTEYEVKGLVKKFQNKSLNDVQTQTEINDSKKVDLEKASSLPKDTSNSLFGNKEQINFKTVSYKTEEKIISTDQNLGNFYMNPVKIDNIKEESDSYPTDSCMKDNVNIKFKKTWITQFELLENTLKNNSDASVNIGSTPSNSPLTLDALINDDFINSLNPLKKSPSASMIQNADNFKQFAIKSKSHSDLSQILKSETDCFADSVCDYNEIRNKVNFLCTPVTNKKNIMTPSVQNSQRKIISRRIQEQLMLLNDF